MHQHSPVTPDFSDFTSSQLKLFPGHGLSTFSPSSDPAWPPTFLGLPMGCLLWHSSHFASTLQFLYWCNPFYGQPAN